MNVNRLVKFHLGGASLDVNGDVTASCRRLSRHDAGPVQVGLEVMGRTKSMLPPL